MQRLMPGSLNHLGDRCCCRVQPQNCVGKSSPVADTAEHPWWKIAAVCLCSIVCLCRRRFRLRFSGPYRLIWPTMVTVSNKIRNYAGCWTISMVNCSAKSKYPGRFSKQGKAVTVLSGTLSIQRGQACVFLSFTNGAS